MTLLVRNEADVIEANLDYHLAQGVDFILVTDHGSTDGTRERLHPYERSGVVGVIEASDEPHHQSRRVTRMAQLADAEHHADWVFHNDADEFWWPAAGRLCDVFAAIPAEFGHITVPRRNFLPGEPGPGPFYSRLLHREAESLNLIGKQLEPKVAHRAGPGVVLAPGNHSLTGVDLRSVPDLELLEILHYPMRSFEQFEAKVIQIGRAYELLEDRSPGVGRDQLRLLEIQRAGELGRYWEEALADDVALARGIETGTIVLDRRLQTFINSLAEDTPLTPVAAEGRMIRAVVAGALQAVLERDADHHTLAEVQADRDEVRRDLAHAGNTLAEIQADRDDVRQALAHAGSELEALRRELAVTTLALDAVRASRVMRWTRRLRRLWYRVR